MQIQFIVTIIILLRETGRSSQEHEVNTIGALAWRFFGGAKNSSWSSINNAGDNEIIQSRNIRSRRSILSEEIENQPDLASVLNVVDNDGNTYLHRAVLATDYTALSILLGEDAITNIPNRNGLTPYQLALSKFDATHRIVKKLAKYEKSVTVTTTPPPPCDLAPSKPKKVICNTMNLIGETINLIQEGTKELFDTSGKDIILVVGNSKSGKSTLTQFLAGDNRQMKAVKISRNDSSLIIIDEGHKIGAVTTVSHTLLPEEVLDTTDGALYIDCPGFVDSRCASFDITAQYFLNLAVVKAKSVKLLFVIEYNHIVQGGDGKGFTTFLTQISKLVREPTKYSSAVAMVVTKAPNFDASSGSRLTQANIQSRVKGFLNEIKRNLKVDEDYKAKMGIMEILTNSRFMEEDSVIHVSFSPTRCGKISDYLPWQSVKGKLRHMISNKTNYVQNFPGDFGFSISTETGVIVNELNTHLRNDLQTMVAHIFLKFNKTLNSNFHSVDQIEDVSTKLGGVMENSNMVYWFQDLLNVASEFGVLTEANYTRSKSLLSFQKFLDQVSNKNISSLDEHRRYFLTLCQVMQTETNLLVKWYEFLTECGTRVAEFCKGKAESEVVLRDLARQGLYLSSYSSSILGRNSEKLVEAASMFLNSFRTSELVDILNFAVEPYDTREDGQSKMFTVSGNVVRISEIYNLMKSHSGQHKSIQIFARHSVIIEPMSLSLPSTNLAIISPNWVVEGSPVIALSGLDGSDVKPPKAGDAKSNLFPGSPGMPGNSGDSSGHFLGISAESSDFENLKLVVNGGRGGKGQGGGKGFDGVNGTDSPWLTSTSLDSINFEGVGNHNQTAWGRYRTFKNIFKDLKHPFECSIDGDTWTYHFPNSGRTYHKKINLLGGDRKSPSAGGCGGTGGQGGMSGSIELLSTNQLRKFTNGTFSSLEGMTGDDGDGGRCSRNGTSNHIDVEVYTNHAGGLFSFGIHPPFLWETVRSRKLTPECMEATKCISIPQSLPQPTKIAPVQNYNTITSYMLFLLKHNDSSARNFLNNSVLNFSKILTGPAIVNTSESISTLVLQIERSRYTLRQSTSLNEIYTSLAVGVKTLLNRESTSMVQRQNLLEVLTVLLSHLSSTNFSSFPVVNIMKYFTDLSQELTGITTSKQCLSVQQHSTHYRSALDGQIQEATNLLIVQVLPQLSQIHDAMEIQITELVRETETRQNDSMAAVQEMIIQKQKLQKAAILRIFFSVIKVTSQIAAVFGPIGSAVGSLVSTTASITESFVVTAPSSVGKPSSSPGAVKSSFDSLDSSFKGYFEKRSKTLTAQFEAAEMVAKEYPTHMESFTAKIDSLKSQLANNMPNWGELSIEQAELEIQKIDKISDELSTSINDKEKHLTDANLNQEKSSNTANQLKDNEKSSARIISSLKHLRIAGMVGSEIAGAIHTSTRDFKAIDEQEGEIEKEEKKLKELGDYERKIYSDVVPCIMRMRATLTKAIGSYGATDPAEILVKKLRVRTIIRDLQLNLKKFTKGFEMQEDLIYVMDKLEEGMSLIPGIFDKLQIYEEQKRLGDYIAKIGTAQSCSQSNNELQMVINSNIILFRVEEAIHSYKQFVFPFAERFFNFYIVPELHNLTESGYNNFLTDSINSIGKIKTNLDLHAIRVESIDTHILTGPFNSRLVSSSPFYTWRNSDWKVTIGQLLSGVRVTLMSNIQTSPAGLDAIKFSEIRLTFKSENKTEESALNKELRHFYLNMTHHGGSYYRCGEEFYAIRGSSLTFLYSDSSSNAVAKKIASGNVLLSPYALWTFTIFQSPQYKKRKFDNLKGFGDKVDLELEGVGQYILNRDGAVNYDRYKLAEFYEKVTILKDDIFKDTLAF